MRLLQQSPQRCPVTTAERLGPVELELLEAIASRPTTIRELSDWTGRGYSTISSTLRRLMRKGHISRKRSGPGRGDGGKPLGGWPAWWSITPVGRRRLRNELQRGRIPGVSAVAAGRKDWF